MKNGLKKYPFFLFLLPLFLVLHIWKEFHPLIELTIVYSEILILFFLPFILTGIFFLLTRSIRKAAVLSLIILLPFFFLGEIKDWLMQAIGSGFFRSYKFLLSATAVFVIICASIVFRTKSNFGRFFFYINTLLIIIIVIDLGLLLYRILVRDRNRDFPIAKSYQPCSNCEKPDIFYLVFDSYTSTGLLNEELNYNNSGA